jgi:hypothetical protein
MNRERTSHLVGVDQATLSPIVQHMTQCPHAELLDWECQALQGGVGDLGSGLVGLYRLTGHISDQGAVQAWSLVLKSAHVAADDVVLDYRLREWSAYHSGFLGDLKEGVRAPQCYGTTRQSETVLRIWLEDLGNIREQHWLQESYAQAAYHFGTWNGMYLIATTRPDFPWFCRSTSREWIQQAAPDIDLLRSSLRHPIVERMYPGDQAEAILRLWEQRDRYLTALEQLPQTICHNDAFRRNLMLMEGADGHTYLVAIDWAYLGWGAVGEELAALVVGDLVFDEVPWSQATEFAAVLFAAYLAGLQQAGWRDDPRLARLGFTAAAAMKYSFPYALSGLFANESAVWMEKISTPAGVREVDESAQKRRFILDLAQEASFLIDALGLSQR